LTSVGICHTVHPDEVKPFTALLSGIWQIASHIKRIYTPMLINTHSHLKRFYQQHQTEIDTLSLLGQLLLTAIAVMFLLSLLGWATAINYAADWCDRLVESSLGSEHPPEPPTVIQLMQQEAPVPTNTKLAEAAATVDTLEPEVPALTADKPQIAFRNIKQQATKNQMALRSVLR
jgi:hypothetical protein